jgi:hypothetical protein
MGATKPYRMASIEEREGPDHEVEMLNAIYSKVPATK